MITNTMPAPQRSGAQEPTGSFQGEGLPLYIFDATPPADFPAQVIVSQDGEFAKRNPDAAYYLRVKGDGKSVETYPLPKAVGPSDARRIARDLGFEPTHWTSPGSSVPHLF